MEQNTTQGDIMHIFHFKSWAVTATQFKGLSLKMKNKRQFHLLTLKNKLC